MPHINSDHIIGHFLFCRRVKRRIFDGYSISFTDLLKSSFVQYLHENLQFILILVFVHVYFSLLDIIFTEANPEVNAWSINSYENCAQWNPTQRIKWCAVRWRISRLIFCGHEISQSLSASFLSFLFVRLINVEFSKIGKFQSVGIQMVVNFLVCPIEKISQTNILTTCLIDIVLIL